MIEQHNRQLLADPPMGAFLIEVLTPILQLFLTCLQASGTSARSGHENSHQRLMIFKLTENRSVHALPAGPTAEPIDKSILTFAEPRRYRNKEHLRFVARQACLVCGRNPSDAHHPRFAQPRALGRRSATNSSLRFAGFITGRSIAPEMNVHGGSRPTSTRSVLPASYGEILARPMALCSLRLEQRRLMI